MGKPTFGPSQPATPPTPSGKPKFGQQATSDVPAFNPPANQYEPEIPEYLDPPVEKTPVNFAPPQPKGIVKCNLDQLRDMTVDELMLLKRTLNPKEYLYWEVPTIIREKQDAAFLNTFKDHLNVLVDHIDARSMGIQDEILAPSKTKIIRQPDTLEGDLSVEHFEGQIDEEYGGTPR